MGHQLTHTGCHSAGHLVSFALFAVLKAMFKNQNRLKFGTSFSIFYGGCSKISNTSCIVHKTNGAGAETNNADSGKQSDLIFLVCYSDKHFVNF